MRDPTTLAGYDNKRTLVRSRSQKAVNRAEHRALVYSGQYMGFRLKKIVLLLLLATMPLQGIAAAIAAVNCDGKNPQRAAHDFSINAAEERVEAPTHDDVASGVKLGGTCCHQLGANAPLILISASAPELPGWLLPAYDRLNRFIPEQPQRPPLT